MSIRPRSVRALVLSLALSFLLGPAEIDYATKLNAARLARGEPSLLVGILHALDRAVFKPVYALDESHVVSVEELRPNVGSARITHPSSVGPSTLTWKTPDVSGGSCYAESESGCIKARYYDPKLGRFISRDPKGVWGDAHQLGNGQSAFGNNPLNMVDPFGLDGNDSVDWSKVDPWGKHNQSYGPKFKSTPTLEQQFIDEMVAKLRATFLYNEVLHGESVRVRVVAAKMCGGGKAQAAANKKEVVVSFDAVNNLLHDVWRVQSGNFGTLGPDWWNARLEIGMQRMRLTLIHEFIHVHYLRHFDGWCGHSHTAVAYELKRIRVAIERGEMDFTQDVQISGRLKEAIADASEAVADDAAKRVGPLIFSPGLNVSPRPGGSYMSPN